MLRTSTHTSLLNKNELVDEFQQIPFLTLFTTITPYIFCIVNSFSLLQIHCSSEHFKCIFPSFILQYILTPFLLKINHYSQYFIGWTNKPWVIPSQSKPLTLKSRAFDPFQRIEILILADSLFENCSQKMNKYQINIYLF